MTLTLWVNLRADPKDGDILLSDMPPFGGRGRHRRLGTADRPVLRHSHGEQPLDLLRALREDVVGFRPRPGQDPPGGRRGPEVGLRRHHRTPRFGHLLTYRGSETAPVSVDGAASLFDIPLRDNNVPLSIGGLASQPNTDLTPPAWMDDIRIYDRVLSASELEAVRQENLVKGSGVLANDSDPDGDPLTAILVSGPAHGSPHVQHRWHVPLPPRRQLQRPRLVHLQGVRRRARVGPRDGDRSPSPRSTTPRWRSPTPTRRSRIRP